MGQGTVRTHRKTTETDIRLNLALYGTGRRRIATTLPFMDHMLGLFAKHAGVNLTIQASGDIEVDDHHLVEDLGITLGQALSRALGSKRGINRYGEARIPMDEALSGVYLDISGRPFFKYKVAFKESFKSSFDYGLIEEFFRALSFNGQFTLHMIVYYGKNNHHKAEALFKAFAQAFKRAAARSGGRGIPSTKGRL